MTLSPLRSEGRPVREIRVFLAEHGIARSHNGVVTLLRSSLLAGEIRYGELRGTVPAVVDRATWDRAQRATAVRGPNSRSGRLLARLGVLRCASCGARMVVGTANHGRYALYRCPPTGDCTRRVTVAAEAAEQVVVEAVRASLDGCVGVRAAQDNIRNARIALQRAQADLDAAIRTLADFVNEPAAVERLRELRSQRDEARDVVERLGAPSGLNVLLLDADWDRLSTEDQRRCILATFDRVLVHPAEPGRSPSERVEVVYHDALERLKGHTPPLPNELSAERDAAITELVETTHYFDEATGEWYEPAAPPPDVFDPKADEDSL